MVNTYKTSEALERDIVMKRVAGRSNFVFKLRAEKDAQIHLFDYLLAKRIYTITIGNSGNEQTKIDTEE